MIYQVLFQSSWQCQEFNLYFPVLVIPVPTGQKSNQEYFVLVSIMLIYAYLLCLSAHQQEGDFSLCLFYVFLWLMSWWQSRADFL